MLMMPADAKKIIKLFAAKVPSDAEVATAKTASDHTVDDALKAYEAKGQSTGNALYNK